MLHKPFLAITILFSNRLSPNLVCEMKKQKSLLCKFGCYEVLVTMETRANACKSQNVKQVSYGLFWKNMFWSLNSSFTMDHFQIWSIDSIMEKLPYSDLFAMETQ